MKDYLRVWKELDLKEIEKSLIVVGDLSSECYACHDIGLDKTAVACPSCGAHFKYMGFRRRVTASFLRKTAQDLPYLVFIDFDDFRGMTNKSDARKLLDL